MNYIYILYRRYVYIIHRPGIRGTLQATLPVPRAYSNPTVSSTNSAKIHKQVIPNLGSYPKNRRKEVANLQKGHNIVFYGFTSICILMYFVSLVTLVLCKHRSLETNTKISLRSTKSPHHQHRPKLLGTAGIPAALLLSHSGQAYRRLFYFHQVRFATLFLN